MHITQAQAASMPATELADRLRTLAWIPGSYSPKSARVLILESASRIGPGPDQPEEDWIDQAARLAASSDQSEGGA